MSGKVLTVGEFCDLIQMSPGVGRLTAPVNAPGARCRELWVRNRDGVLAAVEEVILDSEGDITLVTPGEPIQGETKLWTRP